MCYLSYDIISAVLAFVKLILNLLSMGDNSVKCVKTEDNIKYYRK